VGRAFGFLEAHREEFDLREYVVSQPNLEDLFVSTVTAHSDKHRTITTSAPGVQVASNQPPEPETSGTPEPETGGPGEDLASLDTGLRKEWAWLDRRSHRSLACWTGFFMFICYITIVLFNVGYVSFVFFVSFLVCLFGCLGCCCMIPRDPDESTDAEG